MGTWGTGLYADDTTCDVRDGWLEKLRQGASGETATAEMLKDWGGAEDEPLFWLALADTQWTWGRLEAHVLKRAKEVLAEGSDLSRWDQPKDRAARQRVLDTLAARLKKAAPAAKAVRVKGDEVAWKRGDLWSYRMLDGKYAVFRVAAFDPKCGLVGAPVTELLDVASDAFPSAEAVTRALPRRAREGYNESGRYDFLAAEHRESPMFECKVKYRGELPRHRLKRLPGKSEPRQATGETMCPGVPWDGMDHFLANMFEIGGPRWGGVLAWSLADGSTAHTLVERMDWSHTRVEPGWQLGVLDCGVGEPDARTLENAGTVCSFIVHGFARAGLREVAVRPPQSIEPISGAVHSWESVPRLLANTDKLKAADKAMKALVAAVGRKSKK